MAVEKRQVAAGEAVLAAWTPPSRRKGSTHPGWVSITRNTETPSGSRRKKAAGRPTARKANPLAGTGESKKRMPVRRKAAGNRPAMAASLGGWVGQLAGYGHHARLDGELTWTW